MEEQRIVLQINGMTCEGCAQGITYSLKRLAGVKQVKVDWRTGLAEVAFDPGLTDPQEILAGSAFGGHFSAELSNDSRSG